MTSKLYKPRNPKKTGLWQCIDKHFSEFIADYEKNYQKKYGYFRPIIEEVVKKYIECGDIKKGFARVRCPECAHEYLLSFSCRGRWFCPSCQ